MGLNEYLSETDEMEKEMISAAVAESLDMVTDQLGSIKLMLIISEIMINSIPNHCFGNHDHCSPDLCTTARERLSHDDSHLIQETPEPVESNGYEDDDNDVLGPAIINK